MIHWEPEGKERLIPEDAWDGFASWLDDAALPLGHWYLRTDGRPLAKIAPIRPDRQAIHLHLKGEPMLAIFPYRHDGRLALGGFAIHLSKRASLPHRHDPERLEEAAQIALSHALRLAQALQKMNLPLFLESDGAWGYRIWIAFAKPIQPKDFLSWIRPLLHLIPPPEGVSVRSFPEAPSEQWGKHGRPLPFPLGSHLQSGRRCETLSPQYGTIIPPEKALSSFQTYFFYSS